MQIQEKIKKKNRGGARKGAGRKKVKAESVSLNLNIDKKVAEAMREHFKGDISSLTESYYKMLLKNKEK